MRKFLRWLSIALGVLVIFVAAIFALLQTRVGRAWLEREIAQAISDRISRWRSMAWTGSCRSA